MNSDEGQPAIRKRELVIFLSAGVLESAFYGQLIIFTPLYLPALGVPAGEHGYFTGLLASVTMFIVLPVLQKWGLFADLLTRKTVIARSFLLNAAVAAAAILAGNVWLFLLGRAISLLAMDTNGLLLNYLEKSENTEKSRLATPLMKLAPQVGVFLGPLAAGFLFDAWGFRSLMAVNLALLLGMAWLISSQTRRLEVTDESGSVLGILRDSLALVIKSSRISLLYLALTLLVAGWMLVFSYLPLTISELASPRSQGSTAGLVLGISGLAGILLSYIGIFLGKRIGEFKILAVLAGFCALLCIWMASAGSGNQLAFLWMSFSGFASAGFSFLITVIEKSAAWIDRNLALSLAILPVNGGMILGPVIGSFLSQPEISRIYTAAMSLIVLSLAALFVASSQPVYAEKQHSVG